MTNNKPKVVAWRWRKPVVNDQGETVGITNWALSETPEFLPWWTNEPLVRLTDYETLQAEYRILESELETVKKVAYGNVDLLDENKSLQKDISVLIEALSRCRHQASYSIGGEDALKVQLEKVRDIVSETLHALAAYRKKETNHDNQ